jgi:hypothetical protein
MFGIEGVLRSAEGTRVETANESGCFIMDNWKSGSADKL